MSWYQRNILLNDSLPVYCCNCPFIWPSFWTCIVVNVVMMITVCYVLNCKVTPQQALAQTMAAMHQKVSRQFLLADFVVSF